jgi:mannose-1-phosphate guanylyltransferase/mannose-6-phosphate isomerase
MNQDARGESGHAAAPPFTDLAGARSYYRDWLIEAAFPLWWEAGADHVGGGFLEALTDEGRPALLAAPRRARVQARQVYAYANAGALGWDGPWRAAARHGLDFLLARYLRGPGLVAKSVFVDGRPADESVMLYEQAFTILALSAMARVEPGAGALFDEAARFREALCARLHQGGYLEGGDQSFQANAQMHLLEAALAWEEAGDPSWAPISDAVARLALGRFIDGERGVLREYFDADWNPAPDAAGRLIEPGHQFEWAWLLERWGRARGEAAAHEAALRLYAAGLAGVDAARGVVVGELWDDLSLKDGFTRLWPQTEWLRAALVFGDPAEATRAAQGLALYLQTPARGAWRDKLGPDGTFLEEPAPATSFYHILGACLELFRFGTE